MIDKQKNIDRILNAKSVAVIGASQKIGSVGYKTLKNIIEYGYEGKIFPINSKYDEILGLKTYSSILDINENVDLAIIAVPKTSAKQVVEECGKNGVKGILILSAGFKESGIDGEKLEKEIIAISKKYCMSVIGPNSIGILNSHNKLNANFTKICSSKGNIALISQSGALGCGIMNLMDALPIGISKMISIGNQSDLNVNDFIEYFASDESVDEIILYLEGIVAPNEFREICLATSKIKPIFAIKAGRSPSGSQATMSHTGSLAGNDVFADALMKQAGVIREKDVESTLNNCYAHSLIKNGKANNCVILTNGMGPAILATDKMSELGLNLISIDDDLKEQLKTILSPLASINNPIDMVATAEPETYEKVIKILLDSGKVDTLLVIYLELSDTPSSIIHQSIEKIKSQYDDVAIIDVYISSNKEYNTTLNLSKLVPAYKYTEHAVDAIKSLRDYYLIKNLEMPIAKKVAHQNIDKIIQKAQSENRKLLSTAESLDILTYLDMPICEYVKIKNEGDLLQNIEKISFPAVLKISSTTISHKSDVNGVITNITSKEVMIEKFKNLQEHLKAMKQLENIDYFIVQPMAKASRELGVGFTRDENYGSVIMFGQGGIFIEAQNDVSFRISPLSTKDIQSQIRETRVSRLLGNLRGLAKVNEDILIDCIKIIDTFAQTYKTIKELDINPLLIDDTTGKLCAVDARIILE